MTRFFPPTFSDMMEQFSVKDNNIELINKKESKPIVDWWFLFNYLIIPFFLVLYIGFLLPQKPKILYSIYYIVLSLLILHSFVFSILAFPEDMLRLGGNANDVVNQYLVYLITSCMCGFIFRYLYLKRKERKQLTQATT